MLENGFEGERFALERALRSKMKLLLGTPVIALCGLAAESKCEMSRRCSEVV